MSNSRQASHTQTRDCVLRAHAAEMIARTSLSQEDFAESLYRACVQMIGGEVLCERKVPDLDGLFAANDTAEYLKAAGRWLKRVERWLDKDGVELPAWLEEPWVTALLPEWRDRCLIELAGRYGLLAVRQIGTGPCDALHVFAGISTSFGHVAGIGGDIFADGLFNQHDAQHAEGYESWCRALAAYAIAMADQAAAIKATAR